MSCLKCRFCNTPLSHTFCNLGNSPLSNTYPTQEESGKQEAFYPLHAYVCTSCLLVQLPSLHTPGEIFNEYAYFSSYSTSWLTHCQNYAKMAVKRFQLSSRSKVIEIASNDGYLLQYFKEQSIDVLGIEPAKNVAQVAIQKGIPTISHFFGSACAHALTEKADLLIGNNVLAHVPDLNDFVAGLKIALKPQGVITIEFPHLMRLIEENQFDTIYHEHFSYFSFHVVQKIVAFHGLEIFDVDQLPTHGGSLRIYAQHQQEGSQKIEPAVNLLLEEESRQGLDQLSTFLNFSTQVEGVKKALLTFLTNIQGSKTIAAYGAPAKGNTLLNFCGLSSKSLPFTVDKNPYKQGRYLPGTGIPIFAPTKIREQKPDYLLILPWNLKNEIMQESAYIREWGGKFVIPIPQLDVC